MAKIDVKGARVSVINAIEFDGIRNQADLKLLNQSAMRQMNLLLADSGARRMEGASA